MSRASEPSVSVFRNVLTAAFSILAAISLWNLGGSPPIGVIGVCLLLLGAPLLNRRASIGPQMLARAFWWQAAFLGVLVLIGREGDMAPWLALGGFGALIAAGRVNLHPGRSSFAPVEFRRTLMLSFVLGVADLVALLMYGTIVTEYAIDGFLHDYGDAVPFLIASAAMAVSVYGLYRLKLWGLFACIAANLLVAVAAMTVFDFPDVLMYGLCATALVQLLLPLRILGRIARRRKQLA